MTLPAPVFSRIAVGVDLSDSCLVAVGQSMSLARRCAAPVVLMMVEVEPASVDDLPTSLQGSETRLRAARRERLAVDRRELEALRQRLVGQGVEVSHLVATGDADHGVAATAADHGADLLVVGSHGRHGLSRMLLGSVAEKTVRFASSSVLVARGTSSAAEGGYERIVVGSDFSRRCEEALERAVAVAAPDAHIEVVHAWQVPDALTAEGTLGAALAELRDELEEDVGRTGASLVEAWRQRGVRVTFRSVDGPARPALCERAVAAGADLVVVGSHCRRGLRRLVLGSVAEATVRHAPCSVLVVR